MERQELAMAVGELENNEPRKFKSTTIPFNESEHKIISAAVKKAGYKSFKRFMVDAAIQHAMRILGFYPKM